MVAVVNAKHKHTHTQNCQRMHLLIGVIFVLSVGTYCGFGIDFTSNETAVIDGIFQIVTRFFWFSYSLTTALQYSTQPFFFPEHDGISLPQYSYFSVTDSVLELKSHKLNSSFLW
jgi:hypothetical protein